MAATDQTYRNIKTVHVVFGVSCLLLLLSTIWMFFQDFDREFKPVQKKFRDVETGQNLREMLRQLPRADDLQQTVLDAENARQDYAKAQAEYRAKEKEYSAKRDLKDTTYRTIKASYDSVASYYDMAVEDAGKDLDPRRKTVHENEINHWYTELETLRGQLEGAKKDLDQAELDIKTKVTDPLSEKKALTEKKDDDLKRMTGAFDRAAKATAQKSWKVGDTIRALPIVDGFASSTKINQIVLNELPIDYSFKQVPRYDRCATCHLGIDRAANFTKADLTALTQPQPELEKSLRLAKALLLERQRRGEDLGFDPNDLPDHANSVALTKGEITQYASHPRLDLFVDSNSPHSLEKFGCTICHQGQGSSTSFTLASHTPADSRQTEEWKKNHDWASIHDWDYPMFSSRFVESSCLQCHHQVTDLIRYGSKEEAPKLLRGYNLVKENGCFGCHEIAGIKSGRPVGPDLRLEATPALELLSAADQDRAKADALNPPGTMRKVGPSLRRLTEKTNEDWTRKWIRAPREFREDTKMPHFYGLSTNTREKLPKEQQNFPDAEIYAITHFLFAESKDYLNDKDTYRTMLLAAIQGLYEQVSGLTLTPSDTEDYKKLEQQRAAKQLNEKAAIEHWSALDRKVRGGTWPEKERKDLVETTRNFVNLALLSAPTRSAEINSVYSELKRSQERLQELKGQEDELRHKTPLPAGIDAVRTDVDNEFAKVKAATDRLKALAKPRSVQTEDLVDWEGKPVAKDIVEKAGNKDEGRKLFIEKGCMACHSHEGTEKVKVEGKDTTVIGEANFGPNLSRIAAKLGKEGGNEETKRRWLVQWILDPNVHNPRTRMPVTFLKPQDASDIAAWLLSQSVEFKMDAAPQKPTQQTLVDMARVYLAKAPGMTLADVEKYLPRSKGEDELPDGIPDEQRQFMARDADELALIPKKGEKVPADKLLWYVGKKSISRLGCYGCHDIPGFESAKPIGTALNDWGKKDAERLAFEDSAVFVEHHFNIVESRDDPKDPTKPDSKWKVVDGKEPYEKYFADAVEHHNRQGFLHLKLMDPRSFDYQRLRAWDDRLRMPQFQFSRPRRHTGESEAAYDVRKTREEAEAREAVMTFVLGLLAEPIPLKYVSNPNPDRAAEVRGRQVIDKFNCAGCHQIRPGVYDFKPSKESIQQLEDSFNRVVGNTGGKKDMPNLQSDHLFPMHNAWVGAVLSSPERIQIYGVNTRQDEESRKGNPDAKDTVLKLRLSEALRFTNNDHVLRDVRASSDVQILKRDMVSSPAPPWGGTLVQLLVGAPADPDDPTKNFTGFVALQVKGDGDQARSRLPPPLIREGERVQSKWLYQFLLNPTPIRPEGFMKLRMPRFNMSPDESQAIVNYFAAVSKTGNPGIGLTYPYESIPQRDKQYWAARSREYIKENDNDQAIEARLKAELKDVDALIVDLKKAEKKDDKAIADAEKRSKELKEDIDKKIWGEARKKWLTADVYEKDSYRLLTNRNICLKCHNIGDLKAENASGPPLDLTAERLRPEWTREWISNPNRMFPYNPLMPQNFANDQKEKVGYREISKQWLDSFYGSPGEQAQAVRDALMDLPELRRSVGGGK